MREHLQAAITILSLINPVICGAMFIELEGDDLSGWGLKDASKVAMAAFVVLEIAALVGVRVLEVFGVSLDAFQVAGGIVLVWMGFSMLRGSAHHADAQRPSGDGGSRLAPLILFAASPGTITGVITISAHNSGTRLPVTAMVGVAAAVAVTWVVMLAAARSSARRTGSGLFHDITTRFMGLIVLAMGVQFALGGYQAFLKRG